MLHNKYILKIAIALGILIGTFGITKIILLQLGNYYCNHPDLWPYDWIPAGNMQRTYLPNSLANTTKVIIWHDRHTNEVKPSFTITDAKEIKALTESLYLTWMCRKYSCSPAGIDISFCQKDGKEYVVSYHAIDDPDTGSMLEIDSPWNLWAVPSSRFVNIMKRYMR